MNAKSLDIDVIALTETWMSGAGAEQLAKDPLIRGTYTVRSCTEYSPGQVRQPVNGRAPCCWFAGI
jgi:hypothetical protein